MVLGRFTIREYCKFILKVCKYLSNNHAHLCDVIDN